MLKIDLENEFEKKLNKISELEQIEPEEIIIREVKGYIRMKEEELESINFSL